MKKTVLTTLVLLVSFAMSAQAYVENDNTIRLARVCEMLSGMELPAKCQAKCSTYTPPGGESTYTLKLSKEGDHGDASENTEISVGDGDLGDRKIVNSDKLLISAGNKLQENSIELIVNFDNKVVSLSVNKLECK